MGHVYADVELKNARTGQTCSVHALVDTGATLLSLPPDVVAELDLEVLDQRSYSLSDGRTGLAPYAGPVCMRVGDRHCFGGALVLEGSPLLGVVPMEDMDLVVDPKMHAVAVHPDSTDGPRAFHCGLRYIH